MANIELDGANKKIKVDSGDLTLDVPGDIVLDADGGDLVFADGGTNLLKVTNSSSDVVLQPQVDTKDIVFKQYDGTVVATVEDNATFNIPASKLAIGGTAVTSTAAELNILDGVTSTTAELNIMDGVTATATELNLIDGVTATTAELNILDGVTSTAAELNIVDGNTSATSTTIADADRVVLNDNGTMVQAAVTDLKTYIGGGDMVLITSGGFPDSGDTINFSNQFDNSTYNMFILYFADVYANGSNKITLQFETGGNGTYLTGTDYQRVNHGYDAAGDASKTSGSSEDRITIQTTNANQSNWASRSGYIIFNRPGQSSARKTVHGQISYFSTDSNSPLTIEQFAGMHSDGSNAVTGFRILASASTFEGGSYHLFGLKGS